MPKGDGFNQNIQYPTLADVPDIESAFGTVVNGVVGQTVLRFRDANERAASLTGNYAPRPGMMTYLVAEDRVDVRMGDGTWQPITPGPWQPLSYASGMTAGGGNPGYRAINGNCQLRGRIIQSNGGRFTYSGAKEWLLATLPAAVRPSTSEYWIQATEIGGGVYHVRVELRENGQLVARVPPDAEGTTAGLHFISVAWTYSIT
ncbi:hypothetical protein AB0A77_02090 [Streptomyces varsoviensis]|uniref:hypothetical protein n=1 Tax=Streptomyces varsoviensis TaxID=67373 RepID=UPI0033F69DE5